MSGCASGSATRPPRPSMISNNRRHKNGRFEAEIHEHFNRQLQTVQMVDVRLPATGGRKLLLSRLPSPRSIIECCRIRWGQKLPKQPARKTNATKADSPRRAPPVKLALIASTNQQSKATCQARLEKAGLSSAVRSEGESYDGRWREGFLK